MQMQQVNHETGGRDDENVSLAIDLHQKQTPSTSYVDDDSLTLYSSWDEVPPDLKVNGKSDYDGSNNTSGGGRGVPRIHSSMFPPSELSFRENRAQVEDNEQQQPQPQQPHVLLPLENCMRVLPLHRCGTAGCGGFFVAAMERMHHQESNEDCEVVISDGGGDAEGRCRSSRRRHQVPGRSYCEQRHCQQGSSRNLRCSGASP